MNQVDTLKDQLIPILSLAVFCASPSQNTYRARLANGVSFSTPLTAAYPFGRALSLLRQECIDSGKEVSDGYLADQLMEFLIGLKRKDPKKLKGEIQHDIKGFLGGISRMTIQKQAYLLPVMSLNLGAALSIGVVQIAELTTQFLQVASGQYGAGFSFPPETPADTVQNLVTENGTPTFALVEVEAVDPRRGAQLAAIKADSSLNVLRTFVDLSGGSRHFVWRSDFASRLDTHVHHLDVARKSLSTEATVLNLVASVPSLTAAQVGALAPRMGTIDQLMLRPAEDLTDLESSVLDAVY